MVNWFLLIARSMNGPAASASVERKFNKLRKGFLSLKHPEKSLHIQPGKPTQNAYVEFDAQRKVPA
jgi:hypothetical protein